VFGLLNGDQQLTDVCDEEDGSPQKPYTSTFPSKDLIKGLSALHAACLAHIGRAVCSGSRGAGVRLRPMWIFVIEGRDGSLADELVLWQRHCCRVGRASKVLNGGGLGDGRLIR
jgi:hypothetical protein